MNAARTGRGVIEARKVARELFELLRHDAANRLGLAEAFPQAIDREWTPEFFRKCQLAEKLLAQLDQIIAEAFESGRAEESGSGPESKVGKESGEFPRAVSQSRRRLRV